MILYKTIMPNHGEGTGISAVKTRPKSVETVWLRLHPAAATCLKRYDGVPGLHAHGATNAPCRRRRLHEPELTSFL